jgi:hypothetical protein
MVRLLVKVEIYKHAIMSRHLVLGETESILATSTVYLAPKSTIVCIQLSVDNRYGLNRETVGTISSVHAP